MERLVQLEEGRLTERLILLVQALEEQGHAPTPEEVDAVLRGA